MSNNNNLVPECTGFVSKLTKNAAWVRLNFTTEHFTEEHLALKAKLFIINELQFRNRGAEVATIDDWYLDKVKTATPLFGRNTALFYFKKPTNK